MLFYRFSLSCSPGEQVVPDWDCDKTGIDMTAWQDDRYFHIRNNQGQNFYIEDNYQSYDTHKKRDQVKYALEQAMPGQKHVFHITFNSIAWGPGHHTAYQYAWGGPGVDPVMNKWLGGFISNKGKQRYGAIMLDYYNNEGDDMKLVYDIIRSNFPN